MNECSEKGCRRRATHAPVILIPATGWPREEHRALRIICGLEFCQGHAVKFDPFTVLDQPAPNDPSVTFAEIVPPALARMAGSNLPPDCDRAWVVVIRLDGEEYRNFLASQQPAPDGGLTLAVPPPKGEHHGEA